MPEKIRLLLTINNLDTAGMKHVVADIVENIDRDEFEPSIGVAKLSGSALERRLAELCPVYELPSIRVNRRPRRKFAMRMLQSSLAVASKADVCHSFDYSSDWTEALATKLSGTRFVAEKTNLAYNERRWRGKLALADKVVCLSDAQEQQLARVAQKVEKVPTGVDLERFGRAEACARSAFGMSDDDVVLVSVAHLVEVKGHVELLEAFERLHERLPRLRLLLVGQGDADYTAQLEQQVRVAGLEKKVVFAGLRHDVPEILKMADGKILATRNSGRREAFGAAIVEAMAAGRPVIATRSGGPEEIVVPGLTGWLIRAEDPEELDAALVDFYRSPNDWAEMGRRGQRRASEYFDLETMVERYSAIYRQVAGR